MGYVALTAARTLSPLRTFEALLLMNPRTAAIAEGMANLAAAARALRAGITVVGTRDRPIQLPDVILLDGPRLHGPRGPCPFAPPPGWLFQGMMIPL